MFENSWKTFVEQLSKLKELLRIQGPDDFNILRQQFERNVSLKFDSSPWGIGQEEAEVYVNNAAITAE